MFLKIGIRILAWLLVASLIMPSGIFAQTQGSPSTASSKYKQEELEQMIAPIALYPDDLLAQMFMASTYPLEIVEADRWVKANPNLKGTQLATSLEKQTWDPSVRSLVNFPSVLSMMSDKLDWTQKLGDAFLAQQKDVMNTVQRLRAKAQANGSLKTTNEQKVTTQAQTIIIEPANPQVIYVPAYNPVVVYGAWPYPAYPPYPYYPPGAVVGASMVSFGIGVAVGAAWGYAWGNCNWNHGDVNVNVNKNATVNNTINRNNYANKIGGGGNNQWHHDPDHRKGVAYKDQATAQKYGQTPRTGADTHQNLKGADSAAKEKPGKQDNMHKTREAGERGHADHGSMGSEKAGAEHGTARSIPEGKGGGHLGGGGIHHR